MIFLWTTDICLHRFFITQSRFDYPNYLEEHCMYFFNKCIINKINIHLEICPVKGHKLLYKIHESIAKMKKYIDTNVDDFLSA